MAMRNFAVLIFFWTLVALINGFDLRMKPDMGSPTVEDCTKPPMSKFGHECCRLPKERIWGNLRKSLHSCFKKLKDEGKLMRQEMADDGQEKMTPGSFDMETPTEAPGESSSPRTINEPRGRRPHGKKSHHFRRHTNDSCFMECVFEDQGFLMDNMVNKAAILQRFDETLAKNDVWHKAAVDALEICYQTEMAVPSNQTCESGSEEIFRCIFKHIFFNCPNWTQSDYCMALKDFYQKCPNGPPPEMTDNHSTSPAPSEEDLETSSSTESETQAE